MVRRVPVLLATIIVGALLVSCTGTSPSTPKPTSSASASSSPAPTPSATATPEPTATASPSPTPNPPPRRVVGVVAEMGGGSGEVLLRWTQNPEADVVSYVVLRSTTPGGALTRIGTVSRDEVDDFEYVPFVDSRATVAYYRVLAVDSAGQEGPASTEVCGASVGNSC